MILKKSFPIKVLLLCMFLLCISCSDPQKESDKKIDSLIEKAADGMASLEYFKTIKYAKEAESLALKTNNKKKLPDIYLEMADGLAGLELQKESIIYLNKIMMLDFDNKPKVFKARVNHTYSYDYMELGLRKQALAYNRKTILLLNSSTDHDELWYLAQNYEAIAYYFYTEKVTDSSFYYFKKQENILRKFQEEDSFLGKANIFSFKGYLFLEQKKQTDSARFYFNKAYTLRKKHNDPFLDHEYLGLGECSFLEGDYMKALEYYQKADQNAREKKIRFNENNDINKMLAKAYEALGEPGKQNYYLKKYTEFNDSVKIAQKENVDQAVTFMMNKKTEENTSVKKNYTALLIVILIALSVTGIFIYRYFKKRKIDSDKTEELLVEKEILLSQKEEETQDLRQKVNESFEEVVQLAKDSPEFFTRFKEVYPDIVSKLLEKDSRLRVTELTLCAYFYLGFTSKDVALYTFKAVNTVRNRRQNLRNKFDIPADENMELWLKNL